MTHPNEKLLHTWYEAWSRGDTAAWLNCLTDDAILHFPGRSPLAGAHHGIREFLRLTFFFDRQIGRSRSRELQAVFADDDTGMMLLRTHYVISAAETYDMTNVWVTRFSRGKIAEFWIYYGDQYTVDEVVERVLKTMPTGSSSEWARSTD